VDDDREVEDDLWGRRFIENPSAQSMMPVIEMRMIPADAPQYWNFSLYPYFRESAGTPSPSRGCTGATGKKSSMSCLPMKSWRSSCFLPG